MGAKPRREQVQWVKKPELPGAITPSTRGGAAPKSTQSAPTWSKRTGLSIWGDGGPRRFFGEKHWREPLAWNAAAQRDGVRRRVFCASMADVFELRPDLEEPRAMLWRLIDATPQLDWLLLTKRPGNISSMLPGPVRKNIRVHGALAEDTIYGASLREAGKKVLTSLVMRVSGRIVCTRNHTYELVGGPSDDYARWCVDNGFEIDEEQPIKVKGRANHPQDATRSN